MTLEDEAITQSWVASIGIVGIATVVTGAILLFAGAPASPAAQKAAWMRRATLSW